MIGGRRGRGANLAVDNPILAAQWHPNRNGDLIPANVPACSNKKVWWLCPDCGYEWESTVGNRNHLRNPRGCKECAKAARWGFRRPRPGRSLAERFPDIAAWWHPTKNGDLTPRDVLPGVSSSNVWWQCPRGHEWETSPGNRTSQNTGCPKCNPHATSRFEIDLFHELLAAGCPVEHHYKARAGGRRWQVDIAAVDWGLLIEFDGNLYHRGARAHERDRAKTSALRGQGWNVVRIRQGLEPITDRDLHVSITATALAVTHALLQHLTTLGYPVDADDYLSAGARLGVTQAAEAFKGMVERTFATERPDMLVDWDYAANSEGPETFGVSSGERVWWRCHICGHQWQASVVGRIRNAAPGCRSCTRKAPTPPPLGGSLEDLHPDIAAEVAPDLNDGRTGADFLPGSNWVIWWRCHRSHTWSQSIEHRTNRGHGCRECRKINGHYIPSPATLAESLASEPEIAAWWHPTRNGSVTPRDVGLGSFHRAWWLCPDCGHEWQTTVANRIKQRSGCRDCYHVSTRGIRKPPPGDSAADRFPHVIKQWDPNKNGDLTPWDVLPSAHIKVHWLCERGHETVALLSSRTTGGSGCPECATQDRWDTYRERQAIANSFAAARPDLIIEWDCDANAAPPSAVHRLSATPILWRCSHCGKQWSATPKARARSNGPGCRSCKLAARHLANTPLPGESLQDQYPEIAAEYAVDLNGGRPANQFRPYSNKTVWWRCNIGHVWPDAIRDRTARGRGCPDCRSQQRSRQR